MKILTASQFAPYWGRYPVDVLDRAAGMTIGGGEEAFIRTAEGLAELGHEVHAWHYGENGFNKGVLWYNHERPMYPRLVGEQWDAVVAWSGIKPLEWAPDGAKRIFAQQLNDLTCLGDWSRVDCVVSPSMDHALKVKEWGWLGKRAVVHNGIVPELHARTSWVCANESDYLRDTSAFLEPEPWDSRPLNVGYWSSPDRGLHHLLAGWHIVRDAVPGAKLHVFYEIKKFLALIKTIPVGYHGDRGLELARLIKDALSDPTIIFRGQQPRKVLAEFQRTCRVQAYPYDTFAYCEGFGTSVAQGLAAGCLVLLTPKDAFPSLYGEGVYWLGKDVLDKDFNDWFAHQVIAGLRGELPNQADRIKAAPGVAAHYTWRAAGVQMERACAGSNWF